jgi:hypothetical protein
MSGVIGALHCGINCNAAMVAVAVANEDQDGCSHTRHFEMHSPTTVVVQASSAHPATISGDLELVISLVGVDPVAQVSRVTCANHRIRSINAFLVLITVVNQDIEWSSRHNLTSHFVVAGCDARNLKVHAPTTI